MAQRRVLTNLLLALLGLILALASKSKMEHSTPLPGQVVLTAMSEELGCTGSAEEVDQVATSHVDAAAGWEINRSANPTLSSEDGIAVVLESGRDCTDRYEDTVSSMATSSFRETPSSRTFATIGVDLYHTLIQGTSELVRGTRPDGVRDPGDDPGDRRASRLAELGVGGFSRGLSSRRDGCARGNRGGRSGFPAGGAGGRACF